MAIWLRNEKAFVKNSSVSPPFYYELALLWGWERGAIQTLPRKKNSDTEKDTTLPVTPLASILIKCSQGLHEQPEGVLTQ